MAVLQYKGCLKGHGELVTSISTANSGDNKIVLSTSRDKSLILWKMDDSNSFASQNDPLSRPVPGYAAKKFLGHGQVVSDGALSAAGGGDRYAISSSWDKNLKLWDLEKACPIRTFQGHTSDVTSVSFSGDSRQVVSGSRDKTMRVWNTRGECKFVSSSNGHTDWVSCVRFSPSRTPTIISTSWDRTVKIWSLQSWEVKSDLTGHTGAVNKATISPDGSLCATGGKDSNCILWDIGAEKVVCQLQTNMHKNGSLNDLCFSTTKFWLTAAMDHAVQIWELENKNMISDIVMRTHKSEDSSTKTISLVDQATSERGTIVETLPEGTPTYPSTLPMASCVKWDNEGMTLYVGTSSGDIHCLQRVEG